MTELNCSLMSYSLHTEGVDVFRCNSVHDVSLSSRFVCSAAFAEMLQFSWCVEFMEEWVLSFLVSKCSSLLVSGF